MRLALLPIVGPPHVGNNGYRSQTTGNLVDVVSLQWHAGNGGYDMAADALLVHGTQVKCALVKHNPAKTSMKPGGFGDFVVVHR